MPHLLAGANRKSTMLLYVRVMRAFLHFERTPGESAAVLGARTRLVLALSVETDEQQISSHAQGKEIMANYPHANRFNLSLFDLRR